MQAKYAHMLKINLKIILKVLLLITETMITANHFSSFCNCLQIPQYILLKE